MASNEEMRRWRVEITSLPKVITVDQLALLLQLDDASRIYIPQCQPSLTYYAWINSFDNEQDANDFAQQKSGLILSNLSIKCVAVKPKDDEAKEKRQPLRGLEDIQPLMRSSSMSLIPNDTNISDFPEHQEQTNEKFHRQQQHRTAKEREGRPATPIIKPKLRNSSAKRQLIETIELSSAQYNFLESFGNKVIATIRKEPGIVDVKVKEGKLYLSGPSSVIINVKSYLNQTLHEQNVTITAVLKQYLEKYGKPTFLKRFLQKYSVGISSTQILSNSPLTVKNTTINRPLDSNPDGDQSEDDDDDAKSDILGASANITAGTVHLKCRRSRAQNVFIQVTLCSDSEDVLSKAIKTLRSYSLHDQSEVLTQDEITFIVSQLPKGKLPLQKKTTTREKSFQIKDYLIRFIQSNTNSTVQIFIDYKNGIWYLKMRGFKDHVSNAMSKIKNWLNDNVQTEIQLPISKVMAIFLRTKGSSDIKKLEKTYSVKITSFSPRICKHANDEQDDDDDDHHCLKLTGSTLHISLAQTNVENFLDNLFEQEKDFSCPSWDIAKNISQILRGHLKKIQDSDDSHVIGWIKSYTTAERLDTLPKITLTSVGRNAEAVDDVLEQCQGVIDGYVVWKPSSDEYRAIKNALLGRKTPSIDEFQQQWNTNIRMDRETSTIIIPARSKIIADDIKEALLNLTEETKTQINRISECIPIPSTIRRFVNQTIDSVLEEARSQRVYIESKNPNRITFHGRSDIVTELKQKMNSIIDDIQAKSITHRLTLSTIESDFMRAEKYKYPTRIERDTDTVIRDIKADTATSSSKIIDDDFHSTLTTIVNHRGQTIVVEKGDITKVNNVDAIVNSANGSLYHAGGVDKAIADAAGPTIVQECQQIIARNNGMPIAAGKAVKTTAGNLPFKCIIHAIGPQYTDGNRHERPLLFSSILKSLQLAEDEGCKSIAIPAISSKTYGFPLTDCTNILVRAVKQFFADYPQSKMRKVVFLDLDDTVCNSFARELVVDHSNTVLDNDDNDLVNFELPPLTARWCWQDDYDEKLCTDNDIRTIENAFQQYLKTFTPSNLKIAPDNLRSGTIVIYSIHFIPDLKRILISNPNALNSRLVCGYQMRENTGYKRHLIRYPIEVIQQQQQRINQTKRIAYHPKPLDSYELQTKTTEEYWDIIGMTNASIVQAEKAIKASIHSATVSESFSINLNKDIDVHKSELMKIAIQVQIEIIFEEPSSQQLSMILKGLKANVSDAKLKIALYAQDILTTQVENDDELRIPKEWGDQKEECKLVEISKNDQNFIRIENRMKETMLDIKIDKIERIQNVRLWSHYAFRRREMKKELRIMPNLQIEMELFHGTRDALPSEVYNGDCGFDMRFSTSGIWGIGTYFAQKASYSCNSYAYSTPNGKKQVFLAQVLTGDVYDCQPNGSLRHPPKKNERVSGLRYNSVSGDTGGSKVYIVYENRVAYPTYLITFSS
ncbi:hypothetical protein I4U23_022994 [Adineta vaga]|nr:hypothetical protein I4U23_022994 [Adineta vaga]